jgi:radical SAM/Cys-rich protein
MSDTTIEPDHGARTFLRRAEMACGGPVRAVSVDTLMVNVGLRCDIACAHCHQSSSPERTESMPRDTMLEALRLADIVRPTLFDITGGEPALWSHIRELVSRARAAGHVVRVRTNLVALARPECSDLPAFFAENGTAIFASLPGKDADEVAAQRGAVFDTSLDVLRTLAQLGYGRGDGLTLDIAYNPPAGQLPRSEKELAEEFRDKLAPLGVRFDRLRAIANVPVGRVASRLCTTGEYRAEIVRLARAFNPDVLGDLACRHGIEIAWDGALFDCDFNVGAGLPVVDGPRCLEEVLALADDGADVRAVLAGRRVALAAHCFACTVGAGSG